MARSGIAAAAAPAPKTRGRRSRRGNLTVTPSGWYVVPALVFFLGFVIVPLGVAVVLTFMRWNVVSDPSWVGLANWAAVLTDPDFLHGIAQSFKLMALAWAIQTPLSILLGTFLAGRQRYRSVLATVFLLPLAVSGVAVTLSFKAMLDPNFGLFSFIPPALRLDWLRDDSLVFLVVVFVTTWMSVPFHTLIYQAGARQVPLSLYEAAKLDGAGRVRQFFSITLPQLRNTVVVSSTLIIVGALTYFDIIYVLTSGAPGSSLRTLPLNMYLAGFKGGDFGTASVMAVVLVVIGMTLSLLLTRLSGFTKMTSEQEGL